MLVWLFVWTLSKDMSLLGSSFSKKKIGIVAMTWHPPPYMLMQSCYEPPSQNHKILPPLLLFLCNPLLFWFKLGPKQDTPQASQEFKLSGPNPNHQLTAPRGFEPLRPTPTKFMDQCVVPVVPKRSCCSGVSRPKTPADFRLKHKEKPRKRRGLFWCFYPVFMCFHPVLTPCLAVFLNQPSPSSLKSKDIYRPSIASQRLPKKFIYDQTQSVENS